MITEPFDGLYKMVREAVQFPETIPDSEVMTIYGSEAVATIGEVASEFVFQPVASKVAQFGAGAILGLLASLAPAMPTRGRKELMEISSHLLSRVVDLTPEQIRELKQNAAELIEAVKSMDAARIVEATLRSPKEIKETVEEVTGMKFGEGAEVIEYIPPTPPEVVYIPPTPPEVEYIPPTPPVEVRKIAPPTVERIAGRVN